MAAVTMNLGPVWMDSKKSHPHFIGEAWLDENDTITLRLWRGFEGSVLNMVVKYKKDEKGYADMLRRLGGLSVNEMKLVKNVD